MQLTVEQSTPKLIELMASKRLIILTGAGISYDSGLPLWDELIEEFIAFCDNIQSRLPEDKRFEPLLSDAKSDANKARPERVASALKNELAKLDSETGAEIKSWFDDWLSRLLNGKLRSLKDRRIGKGLSFPSNPGTPNEYHETIVKTNFPFILTANYDKMLEDAADSEGLFLSWPSMTFKEPSRIAAMIYEKKPAIIHLHGHVNDINIGEFVFTSKDYAKIKRLHPGFRLAIESLFIKFSTLYVGYGGSDPHLEDISEELSLNLWKDYSSLPQGYMLLHKSNVDEVLTRYKDIMRTNIVVMSDYSEGLALLRALQTRCPKLI